MLLNFCPIATSVRVFICLTLLFAAPLPASCGAGDAASAAYLSPLERGNDRSRFFATVRQRDDFSCGAAALATLLIYHYGWMIAEEEIFGDMLSEGDQRSIRANGFSLLDMKNFLDANGYDSAGYEIDLDRLVAMGLPGIALISISGSNHFVVVKGVSADKVLVGDPLAGIRAMPRSMFADIWNGVIFIVRSNPIVGRKAFNRGYEWEAGERATKFEEWTVDAGEEHTSIVSEVDGIWSADLR